MSKDKELREQKVIRRTFETRFECKRDDDASGAKIVAHPIVYNAVTDISYFREVIEPGALNGADLTDVLFFVNHDSRKIPLARSRRNNGNSTMKLSVDSDGLHIEALLDTENNTEAKSLYSAVSRGDITGMSFAFRVKDERWEGLDTETPIRYITKFEKISEISAVNFPAYEQTSIEAREALENAKSGLENPEEREDAPDGASVPDGTDAVEQLKLEREKTRVLYG